MILEMTIPRKPIMMRELSPVGLLDILRSIYEAGEYDTEIEECDSQCCYWEQAHEDELNTAIMGYAEPDRRRESPRSNPLLLPNPDAVGESSTERLRRMIVYIARGYFVCPEWKNPKAARDKAQIEIEELRTGEYIAGKFLEWVSTP